MFFCELPYGLLKMLSLSRFFVFFFLCVCISPGFSEEKGDKKSKWTKEVDNRNIQFGSDAEKQSADAALNAIKQISNNIQNLKKDRIATF